MSRENNFQWKLRNGGISKDYRVAGSLKRQRRYTDRTNIIFDVSRFRCLFFQQSNISRKKVIYGMTSPPRRIIAKDDDNGGESFVLSTSGAIREWSTEVTFHIYSYNNPLVNHSNFLKTDFNFVLTFCYIILIHSVALSKYSRIYNIKFTNSQNYVIVIFLITFNAIYQLKRLYLMCEMH